jgi:hypothetical protein
MRTLVSLSSKTQERDAVSAITVDYLDVFLGKLDCHGQYSNDELSAPWIPFAIVP